MALLKLVYSFDVVLGVEFCREPQRTTDDRTSPEAHIGRVLKSNMTAHVDLDELLTIGAGTVIHTLPLLQDRVEFVPIGTSLESQGVGEGRRT